MDVEKYGEYATKKVDISVFIFVSGRFIFFVVVLFLFRYFHHSPMVWKNDGARPALRRALLQSGYMESRFLD